jgi:hypothetical protein
VVGLLKKEENDFLEFNIYVMIIKFNQYVIQESASEIEQELKQYSSLKQLKASNPELYKKALDAGLLTKYFSNEVSVPTKPVEKTKANKIYDVLDNMEKKLDAILKRYEK